MPNNNKKQDNKIQCSVSQESFNIINKVKWGNKSVFIDRAIQEAAKNPKFQEWFFFNSISTLNNEN